MKKMRKRKSKKEKEGILLFAVAKQACICMTEMSREAHNKLNVSYDTSVLKFPSLPSDIDSKPVHPRNQMSGDIASPFHHRNVRSGDVPVFPSSVSAASTCTTQMAGDFEAVPLVEFMYLVSTRMPDESCCRSQGTHVFVVVFV